MAHLKDGNWIPMSAAMAGELPTGRPFSKVEAMYSLQLDYDRGNDVTITGLSCRWKWGIGKVYRFLNEIGVEINYPESTARMKNQHGSIVAIITEVKRNDNGIIKFINNKELQPNPEVKRKESGIKAEVSQIATIQTNKLQTTKKDNIVVLVVDYLNAVAGKDFRASTKTTAKLINGRVAEGYGFEDFKKVIDEKSQDKYFIANPQYMSPSTLFSPGNFEKYLNSGKKLNGEADGKRSESQQERLQSLKSILSGLVGGRTDEIRGVDDVQFRDADGKDGGADQVHFVKNVVQDSVPKIGDGSAGLRDPYDRESVPDYRVFDGKARIREGSDSSSGLDELAGS